MLPLALFATGCEGPDEMEVTGSASCSSSAGCEAKGSITAKWKRNQTEQYGDHAQSGLTSRMMQSSNVIDAAQFSLDVGGSSVVLPSAGLVTLTLVDSATGQTQTTGTFAWRKYGDDLVFSDPNAVNDWAYSQGGTADSLHYALQPFNVVANTGSNRFEVATQYEGQTYATASTTWYSGGGDDCRNCQVQ